MHIVIFAGGVGTRLWPVSRENSPKQFEKLIDGKSTLQLAVERLRPEFDYAQMFIATSREYIQIVEKQIPQIPSENIIGEPARRDVGPAVGLVTAILEKIDPNEPMLILWSDHIVKKEKLFKKIIDKAAKIVRKEKEKIIFIGQTPRFASQNLGWIECGERIDKEEEVKLLEFKSFLYRPDRQLAEKFFRSGRHLWNPGYFVTTPAFLMKQYKQFTPDAYKIIRQIAEKWGRSSFQSVLEEKYANLEKIHFDRAILEKLDYKKAYVIASDIGWSDVGACEALKEALQESPEQNITKGKVLITDCQDSLIYNYTDQAVAAIDIKGMLVVATKDAILVCDKNSVPKIKNLVQSLSGTKNENLI